MKTTIEIHGYEIKIDEMNDRILVSAVKDGETVEEFELDVEAGFEDEDDMEGMEAFGEEEEEDFDMGDEDDDMGDDDDDEEFDDDEMGEEGQEMEDEEESGKKLESFNHFVRRKK
jgi:hypothetical protein